MFDDLNRYQATMHFSGQSTVNLDGDRATGESYCIAHHLFTDHGERKLMVAWLRYGDTFAKIDGAWQFAERNLYVDWTETRSSQPSRYGSDPDDGAAFALQLRPIHDEGSASPRSARAVAHFGLLGSPSHRAAVNDRDRRECDGHLHR